MTRKVTKEDMEEGKAKDVEYWKGKLLTPKAVLEPLSKLLKHKDPRIQLGAIKEAKDITGLKAPEKTELDIGLKDKLMDIVVAVRQEEKTKKPKKKYGS